MEPYIGEIKLWPVTRVPVGWVFCDGSTYQISEYDTLFALLGTTYGGDGVSTFAVPDLRGRVPMGQGQGAGLTNRVLGQALGTEELTLLLNHLPAHQHALGASNMAASSLTPANNLLAAVNNVNLYGSPGASGATTVQLAPATIGQAGGSQPHDNMMPFLCVNYIIATQGIYPSPN